MHCPGSIRLSEGLPEVETEYQREGSTAHALAAVWLKQGEHAAQNLESVYVGGSPEQVTDEMREGVRLFVDTVKAARAPGSALYVEQVLSLALLNPPEPMFGTADALVVAGRVLRVFDFKYGQGVVVEVRDNPQLLYYVLGAVLAEFTRRVLDERFEFTGAILTAALNNFDEITVTIVQPRAGHADGPVRTVTVTAAELTDFAQRLIDRADDVTHTPVPELIPGEWCRFCPAQSHCPALQQHAQLVAQVDFDSVPVDTPVNPETISIERAADLLTKVQVLESWVRALYERVTRELESGREVPGWKLVAKRARRMWGNPQEVEEWCRAAGLRPADMFEPRALRSPAQLEKIVGKKNLPETLYVRVSSGLKLAPASDPRPAAAIGPQEDFAALPRGSVEADLVETES